MASECPIPGQLCEGSRHRRSTLWQRDRRWYRDPPRGRRELGRSRSPCSGSRVAGQNGDRPAGLLLACDRPMRFVPWTDGSHHRPDHGLARRRCHESPLEAGRPRMSPPLAGGQSAAPTRQRSHCAAGSSTALAAGPSPPPTLTTCSPAGAGDRRRSAASALRGRYARRAASCHSAQSISRSCIAPGIHS
jgi:hypothetical protein